jgi:hypothetical protein
MPIIMRARRQRCFAGYETTAPHNTAAKRRIWKRGVELTRPTEPGKHWGMITAKHLEVLRALLWRFHNAATGKCFPAYEALAEAAGCARSTVYEAINALKALGLLDWQNRIKRIQEPCEALLGPGGWRWRVLRTSNGYLLIDPQPSKSELQPGTEGQDSFPSLLPSETALGGALARLKAAVVRSKGA